MINPDLKSGRGFRMIPHRRSPTDAPDGSVSAASWYISTHTFRRFAGSVRGCSIRTPRNQSDPQDYLTEIQMLVKKAE